MFVVNGRFLTQKITGIQRYAFEICNKLYEMGIDFYVAIPKEINPDYQFEFKTIVCGNLNGHLWEQFNLPTYLKKNGNPLLISFSGCGPLNYTNQIITIHDVSHERYPNWFPKNYCRFYGFMMPRIAKKAHAVITVSEFSKQEIVETLGVDATKIEVIHSNVPKGMKSVKDDQILEVLDGEKYIITVSNMDPRKNFIRLVEAFNLLDDKSIKLYIIGMKFKAFNTPDLQKLMGENIILPGYVDEETLKNRYRHAILSVYPTLYEGFGLPPLESMTLGCPVINSDIPALREISGDAALYINPLDTKDIANQLDRLIKDATLRDKLREKGFEQVKKYSWDLSAQKVLNLISKYL